MKKPDTLNQSLDSIGTSFADPDRVSIVVEQSMKLLFGTFLLVSISVGCSNSASSDFAFKSNTSYRDLGIEQHQEGFFILRYRAYQGGHDLGGTHNEISIRNLSNTPMIVETLMLEQKFRDREVTVDDAPIPYDGLNGGTAHGNIPTDLKNIPPGEWMSFDFPTKEIQEFEEGDELQLKLSVSLRAGTQHYNRIIEFKKTLVKVELPAL